MSAPSVVAKNSSVISEISLNAPDQLPAMKITVSICGEYLLRYAPQRVRLLKLTQIWRRRKAYLRSSRGSYKLYHVQFAFICLPSHKPRWVHVLNLKTGNLSDAQKIVFSKVTDC